MKDTAKHSKPAKGDSAGDGAGEQDRFGGAVQQQQDRREQLRYVQEFINNPLFIDLSDSPITTSSSRAEIAERKSDLSYRMDVLTAILTILGDELEMLEKVEPGHD